MIFRILFDDHNNKIQSFKIGSIQYFLNLYYVPGFVAGTGNVARNNLDSLFSWGLIQWGAIANDDPCFEGNYSEQVM